MQSSRIHPHIAQSGQAILIVIDMQEPFLRAIYERERVVANVSRLIRGAKVLRVPAISTVQNQKAMGDVIPELRPLLSSPPLDKMTFSCYADRRFVTEVGRSGRRQAILCGVESHICVCQTALAMIDAGFQVQVCADAVSSRTAENWQVGIDKVKQAGGLATATESVLYEMLQEAGTADFRGILQIVK